MSENSTIQFKFQRFSTNDSSKTETLRSSRLTTFQVFMILLVLMDLMISINVMNLMDLFLKKTINAQELILNLLKERAETGRLYIMNIDHCNSHSSFQDKVEMSNLCQEITLPTVPLEHIDGEGEIALCILSAVNIGKIRDVDDLEELCDLAVRGLDELIDYQDYPITAAEVATKNRRSLGVGYIGLAHYLAKQGIQVRFTRSVGRCSQTH